MKPKTNGNSKKTNGEIKKTNGDAFYSKTGHLNEIALKADSLCKTYNGNHEAVKDVTFSVKTGEVKTVTIYLFSFEELRVNISLFMQCFGLLGSNGAGKSTIFSMLSGELQPTSGTVSILNRDDGIAYCPQSNALDSLLTVEEIINLYGQLRRITNIEEV